MDIITYEDFMKLDIRIGKILSAERVEGTDKLLKLEMEVGDEKRDLVAGIAASYSPEDIIGKLVPVLLNLQPRKIRGIESQGMILAADNEGEPVILNPDKGVPSGSSVR
jgi:methionine--tRNA ligase beta chain